jgi:hypothetical protein
LSPLLLTLLAGAGIDLFLADGPDTESFQSASGLAFLVDTMITLFVVSFVIRKMRQKEPALSRNTLWLRRLFAFGLIASTLHNLISAFLDVNQFNILNVVFFSLSAVATGFCAASLRKTEAPTVAV